MSDREHITLPREVGEFVLKHLEWWSDDEPQKKEAIEALRAALAAEQQKPEDTDAIIDAGKKKHEAKQEPVAYFDLQKQVFYWARPTMIDVPMTVALEPLPLYTALAAEQPKHDLMKWAKDAGSSPEDLERFATYTIATRDMEIATLREENEALRRDAERYRYLRDKAYVWDSDMPKAMRPVALWLHADGNADIDAAIDAAMGDKR